MTSHMGAPFARRDFIKLIGAGTAGAAGLALPATAAATSTAARPTATRNGATVTLFVNASNAVDFDQNGIATFEVEIGNSGPDDAQHQAFVRLVAPFLANFDDNALPTEFQRYIVNSPEPNIPQVMECVIPASRLHAGQRSTFDVTLKRLPNGPTLPGDCRIYVLPDGDTSTPQANNRIAPTFSNPYFSPPSVPDGRNEVNLYMTYVKPVLSGDRGRLRIMFGNTGPLAPGTDPLLTFVTPCGIKIDRDDSQFDGLHPVYQNTDTDPWVPDVVTIPVPRTALLPDPNLTNLLPSLTTVSVPLVWHGEPETSRTCKAYLATQGTDFDPDVSLAISQLKVSRV